MFLPPQTRLTSPQATEGCLVSVEHDARRERLTLPTEEIERSMPMFVQPAARETLALLDTLEIEYRYYNHDLARTMADCEGIGSDVGAQHFKNLFLADRKRSVFVLLLLSPEKTFRTGEISRQLGTSRLSFCTPEELMDKLGLLPGSVTPLALARESARGITVAVDRDILSMETICAHPCAANASVALSREGLFRFLTHCGNEIRYVDAL